MLLGAGTVLTVEQAEKAVTAGARFIVSPGFGPAVVDWCLRQGVPVLPGVATPTEIMMALDKGIKIVKFFPAEALGGIATLKALSAPFGGVKFMPTGGVSAANLSDYLGVARGPRLRRHLDGGGEVDLRRPVYRDHTAGRGGACRSCAGRAGSRGAGEGREPAD